MNHELKIHTDKDATCTCSGWILVSRKNIGPVEINHLFEVTHLNHSIPETKLTEIILR